MAKVGAQRAAVLTGKSKSTIQRAMNSGKISFELDSNRRRVVDVSELERVFGIKQQEAQQASKKSVMPDADVVADAVEKERMRMQIKMLEKQLSVADERLDDLMDQRDKWERQASQILITSQYSQKQVEELRTQIKEREEIARQRRLQNAKAQKTLDAKRKKTDSSMTTSAAADPQDLGSKMKKLKAQNENAVAPSASVFRFWKKSKS